MSAEAESYEAMEDEDVQTDALEASPSHADMLDQLRSATADLPTDPHERAHERLSRLKRSFAGTMAITAEMYRDEDWKYLTRENGLPYMSLAEVLMDVMNVTISMARRYVQGARDFYLPLSEVVIDGASIEITSGQVASLGAAGIEDAVSTAKERLEGVEDPEEAEAVIRDAVAEAQARKAAADAEGDWEDSDEPAPKKKVRAEDPVPGSGATTSAEDADWESDGGDEEDLSKAHVNPNAGEWQSEGADWNGGRTPDVEGSWDEGDDWEGDGGDSIPEDPIQQVLEGADRYTTPEALATLEEPLRSVAAALLTLNEMDPDEIARMVQYDTRGVLLLVDDAQKNTTRFRTMTETQAWMFSHLPH